jgi:hypothetical protein
LRSTSLNYYNLEIDTPTVSWDNLLARFQEKQNLSFTSQISSQAPVALVSIRHSSYSNLKTAVLNIFPKRGVRTSAKALAEVARKFISDNPSNVGTVTGAVITGAIALFGIKKAGDSQDKATAAQDKATAAQREATAAQDKATAAQRDATAAQREATAEAKRQNDLTEKSLALKMNENNTTSNTPELASTPNTSGLGLKVLDKHRNKDGNIILIEPSQKQSGAKKGSKDMAFTEEDSPSVVRLDGSRVEDIIYFFI